MKKPLVIVGLDLLRSMKVRFGTVIENNLKFQTFDLGHDDVVPVFVQSGSPCKKGSSEEIEVELVEQSLKHADTAGSELEKENHNRGIFDPDLWVRIDPDAVYHITTFG